jgi:hypothetical protein
MPMGFGAIKAAFQAVRASKGVTRGLHNMNMVTNPIYKSKYLAGEITKEMKTIGKEVIAGRASGINVKEKIQAIRELGVTRGEHVRDWRTLIDNQAESIVGGWIGDVKPSVDALFGVHAGAGGRRLKGVIGTSAVIGGGIALVGGENPLWGAAKFAAAGAMYETLFPVVMAFDAARTLAEVTLSAGRAMDQMDRSIQITRLQRSEKYNPVGPPTPDVGNTRRRSASYQQYSKQNQNSFIGSEASFQHDVT